MDKTLLDPPEGSKPSTDRPIPSPMPPPSTPDNSQGQVPEKAPSTPKSEQQGWYLPVYNLIFNDYYRYIEFQYAKKHTVSLIF